MTIQISPTLNIPISGKPVQDIMAGPEIKSVALLGDDYAGMRPTLLVGIGDKVKAGQHVFEDKKNPGVFYTAPASGTVRDMVRGAKRRFLAMIIDIEGDESDQETFESFNPLEELERETIESQLIKSGLWTALRTRPFSKVPAPGSEPNSIFVTAMDTSPLSPEPELIIDANKDMFVAGLVVVSRLTSGTTYVCTREDSRVPGKGVLNVEFEQFAGGHPAGLPGTHIHFLDPVSPKKTVWHISYQDVIAIGHLFKTGKIMTERVVAVGGPRIKNPQLVKTRLGASIQDLVAGNLNEKKEGAETRLISGSLLCGRHAEDSESYLGRYHTQVAALEEGTFREFLGWQMPGFDKFSVTRIYGGSWLKDKLFPLTTSSGGSKRAIVPVGTYERVMPLDILPTPLLKALITGDTDQAQALGCLELSEEDLGLCTYVCPGKYDYPAHLRSSLETIEKEG